MRFLGIPVGKRYLCYCSQADSDVDIEDDDDENKTEKADGKRLNHLFALLPSF